MYLFGKEVQTIKPQGLGTRAGVDCPQQDTPSSIKPASVHLVRNVAAPQQGEVLPMLLTDGLLKQCLHRSTVLSPRELRQEAEEAVQTVNGSNVNVCWTVCHNRMHLQHLQVRRCVASWQ